MLYCSSGFRTLLFTVYMSFSISALSKVFINHLKESPPCGDCKTYFLVKCLLLFKTHCNHRNLVAEIDGTMCTYNKDLLSYVSHTFLNINHCQNSFLVDLFTIMKYPVFKRRICGCLTICNSCKFHNLCHGFTPSHLLYSHYKIHNFLP